MFAYWVSTSEYVTDFFRAGICRQYPHIWNGLLMTHGGVAIPTPSRPEYDVDPFTAG